jgi:nuclear pore complex protein Nup53
LNTSQSKTHTQSATPNQPTYIIVFGYPPDKYSLTVEYFRSLGASTEPEPNTEIVNAFRIGFRDPGEAMRAVRRNGEVLGGTWMVGVKWVVRFFLSMWSGVLTPTMHEGLYSGSPWT